MFRLSLTHKAIYTLIVFTLFCCVGHLTAERTQRAATAAISAPFQEGGAYLMESKTPSPNTGTRGEKDYQPFLFLLLGIILYSMAEKSRRRSLPNSFLPRLSDYYGMLPLPLAPPSSFSPAS